MKKKIAFPLSTFLIMSCVPAHEQPNIIFIFADDLSYRDLSSYGQERFSTPNLDALVSTGIRFTQAYSAAPTSAPSRGCLMTGLHTGHGPIRINNSARGQEHLLDSDVTVAEVLQKSGYHTAFTGKWGIGPFGTEGVPYEQGFDYSFGFYDQFRAHTLFPEYLYENEKRVEYPENVGFDLKARYNQSKKGSTFKNHYDEDGRLRIEELKDPYRYAYSPQETHNASMRFLANHKANHEDEPFFLYYATQLPHGPLIIDNIGEMSEPDSISLLTREWAAMVMRLDDHVGEIVSWLKANGEYDNTIIFFASDNGYSQWGYTGRAWWADDPWLKNKGPFEGGKFASVEGGVRIPFFVSCPKRFPAQVIGSTVWLPDFFPTASELANNDNSYRTDGISLLPLLEGRDEEYVGHHHLYFSKGAQQSVRMGPWGAYRKDINSPTRLHLLEEDTYTERDVSDIYPDIVKEIETIMDTSFTSHPWYRTPDDSNEDYQKKIKLAKEAVSVYTDIIGNISTVYDK